MTENNSASGKSGESEIQTVTLLHIDEIVYNPTWRISIARHYTAIVTAFERGGIVSIVASASGIASPDIQAGGDYLDCDDLVIADAIQSRQWCAEVLLVNHGENRHPSVYKWHSLVSPLLHMHALIVASHSQMAMACASAFSLLSPLDGSLIAGCPAFQFSSAVDAIASAQVVAWRNLAVWRSLNARFSAHIQQNKSEAVKSSQFRKTSVFFLLESFYVAIQRSRQHALQLSSVLDDEDRVLSTAETELVGFVITSAATIVSCLRYFLLRKQHSVRSIQDDGESENDEEFHDVFGFGELRGDARSDSVPPPGIDVFHKHLRDARDPTVVRPDDQVVFAALKTVCGMDFQMGMSASMLPPALQSRSARPPVSESESTDVPLSVPPPPFPIRDMKKSAATFRFAPTSRRALVLVGKSAAQKGTDQSRAEIRVESIPTSTQRSASVGDVVPFASGASSSIAEPRDVSQSTSCTAPLQTPSIASFTLDAATLQELEIAEAARWVFFYCLRVSGFTGEYVSPPSISCQTFHHFFSDYVPSVRSADCSGGSPCPNSTRSIRASNTTRAR